MGKPKVRHNRTSTKGKVFPAGRGGEKKKPIVRGLTTTRCEECGEYIETGVIRKFGSSKLCNNCRRRAGLDFVRGQKGMWGG